MNRCRSCGAEPPTLQRFACARCGHETPEAEANAVDGTRSRPTTGRVSMRRDAEAGEVREVDAWDVGAAGLLVTRSVGPDLVPRQMMFTITHAPSGWNAIGLHTPRRADAEAAARALGELTAWTDVDPRSPSDDLRRAVRAVYDRLLHDPAQDWYRSSWDPPEGAEIEPLPGQGYRFRADGGPWRRHAWFQDICDAIAIVRAGDATWDQVGGPWPVPGDDPGTHPGRKISDPGEGSGHAGT